MDALHLAALLHFLQRWFPPKDRKRKTCNRRTPEDGVTQRTPLLPTPPTCCSVASRPGRTGLYESDGRWKRRLSRVVEGIYCFFVPESPKTKCSSPERLQRGRPKRHHLFHKYINYQLHLIKRPVIWAQQKIWPQCCLLSYLKFSSLHLAVQLGAN